MNIERREGFASWFADVGYLYIVVVLLIALAFLFRDLRRNVGSVEGEEPPSSAEVFHQPTE